MSGPVVIRASTPTIVVRTAPQGPPGPPGVPGTGAGSHIAQTDDTLLAGSPVFITGTGTLKLAAATGLPQARLAALSEDAVPATLAATITTQGLFNLTTAEWDAVTGQTGGLTSGAMYFLSTTTGMITVTAPTSVGDFVVKVGKALDTTTMDVDPRSFIKL